MHLEIRKYPNRRYYDTTNSRHLTLEDIRQLIRQGHDVTVTDSKSGQNITAQVLTQIIMELETSKIGAFPVNLLTHLIRMNDHVVQDFLEGYVQQAANYFLQYQQQMHEQLRQAPFFSPWTGWGPGREGRPAAGAGEGGKGELSELVKRLQDQIDALKKELKNQRKPRKRKGSQE